MLHDFYRMLMDAAPAFGVALILSAAAIVLTRRSVRFEAFIRRIGASLPLATVVGAAVPGCALSTLPLALVLRRNGAKVGTLTAFIVTAAVLGPSSVILTGLLLDWQMALFRIVLPLGAVLILGATLNSLSGRFALPSLNEAEKAVNTGSSCCGGDSHQHAGKKCCSHSDSFARSFATSVGGMLKTLAPLLIIGLMAAAVLRQLIPDEFIQDWLQQGFTAYLAAVTAGIPAYVCEGGEVPLTLALLNLGVGPGPAFTFLLAAVGTCIPTMLIAPRIIGIPATIAYAVFWVIFAIGSGMFVVLLL